MYVYAYIVDIVIDIEDFYFDVRKYIVINILLDIEEKKLRYWWSKSVGLEPPPSIVPYIKVFEFNIEVLTSI